MNLRARTVILAAVLVGILTILLPHLFPRHAFAWSAATHVFIVDTVYPDESGLRYQVYYGSFAPDISAGASWPTFFEDTHINYYPVVNLATGSELRSFALGYELHNNTWGADSGAHDPVHGYVALKSAQLQQLDPDVSWMAHGYIENAVDLLVKRELFPDAGQQLMITADCRDPGIPELLAQAYESRVSRDAIISAELAAVGYTRWEAAALSLPEPDDMQPFAVAMADWGNSNGNPVTAGQSLRFLADAMAICHGDYAQALAGVSASMANHGWTDTGSPEITSLSPSGTLSSMSATLAVGYMDPPPASGIDDSAVYLVLDGIDISSDCTATTTNITCDIGHLEAGVHLFSGSVADLAGNTSAFSGSFHVECAAGKPGLTLAKSGAYWASYADFLMRDLTVEYTIGAGGETAYCVEISGSLATNGVTCSLPMPVWLGTIPAGGSVGLPVTYRISPGTNSFRATIYATAQDGCGSTYFYPGPYPGL